jgi:hypothetical protein
MVACRTNQQIIACILEWLCLSGCIHIILTSSINYCSLFLLCIVNRAMRLLRDEVRALRGEVERVIVGKKEMTVRLESLTKDILWARTENEKILVLTDDLEAVSEELMRTRSPPNHHPQ